MTIRQALAEAIRAEDIDTLARIVDGLRTRGYDYRETFEAARRAVPDLSPAQWDALMYRADEEAA